MYISGQIVDVMLYISSRWPDSVKCIDWVNLVQFSSVAQSCPTLCDPMNCSTPGLPVHHQLPEFPQTHDRWCHPAISSSVVPFSSYPQFLPALESFPMSQLFAWGGQSTGPCYCNLKTSHSTVNEFIYTLDLGLKHSPFSFLFISLHCWALNFLFNLVFYPLKCNLRLYLISPTSQSRKLTFSLPSTPLLLLDHLCKKLSTFWAQQTLLPWNPCQIITFSPSLSCYLPTFRLFSHILKTITTAIFECDCLFLLEKSLHLLFADFMFLHWKGEISSRSLSLCFLFSPWGLSHLQLLPLFKCLSTPYFFSNLLWATGWNFQLSLSNASKVSFLSTQTI